MIHKTFSHIEKSIHKNDSIRAASCVSPAASSALKYYHVRADVARRATLLSHQVDLAVPASLCVLD